MSARTVEDVEQEDVLGVGTAMDTGEDIAAMDTIRRGIAFSPELKEGLGGTLALAVVASVGQVVVPVVVQQTLDRGLNGPNGPDVSFTVLMGVVAAAAIAITSLASYLMTKRLFTTAERGLATLRIKAFRHVHDLPVLTQNTERRGVLVSRVTSDVDQVSQFLVFGGLFFDHQHGPGADRDDRDGRLQLAAGDRGVGLLRTAVHVAALLPAQAGRGLRHRPPPGRRDARRDLRAGRRRRGGPLLLRGGPHPGAHRRPRSTTSRRRAPAPRGSRSSRSRSAVSPRGWPTPGSSSWASGWDRRSACGAAR